MATTLERQMQVQSAQHPGQALTTECGYSLGDDEVLDARVADVRLDSVVVGLVVEIDGSGTPVVDFVDNAHGRLPARSLIPVTAAIVGREVTLLFERSDPTKPIIIGAVWAPGVDNATGDTHVAEVDGERITLTGKTEIVLSCGKASITLTRAGKVLIKGEYVLTHAGGVNRIRGGSVQIN